MPMADGHNRLVRVSLRSVAGGAENWYRFKVNPESYREHFPQRATTYKTKTSIVIEDFGPDVATISFSGTTGFRRDARGRSGLDRLKELKAFVEQHAGGGERNVTNYQLEFYNNTNGYSYVVHLAPEALTITQDVNESLLTRYEINLIVIRKTSTTDQYADNTLGNRHNGYISTTEAINPHGSQGVWEGAVGGLANAHYNGRTQDSSGSNSGNAQTLTPQDNQATTQNNDKASGMHGPTSTGRQNSRNSTTTQHGTHSASPYYNPSRIDGSTVLNRGGGSR